MAHDIEVDQAASIFSRVFGYRVFFFWCTTNFKVHQVRVCKDIEWSLNTPYVSLGKEESLQLQAALELRSGDAVSAYACSVAMALEGRSRTGVKGGFGEVQASAPFFFKKKYEKIYSNCIGFFLHWCQNI